jgi:hypothetical protein
LTNADRRSAALRLARVSLVDVAARDVEHHVDVHRVFDAVRRKMVYLAKEPAFTTLVILISVLLMRPLLLSSVTQPVDLRVVFLALVRRQAQDVAVVVTNFRIV